jgi:uncharacterized cupin superfamily protein
MNKSEVIKHWTELHTQEASSYPGSQEKLSHGASLGEYFGFSRLGIHHEQLFPGHRTSWPHAESTEDEFVHVLEGTPDVWLDGELHPLQPGDSVGFKAGTGLSHTFINNSNKLVRLLVIGDVHREDNRIHYARHPQRNFELGVLHWHDVPSRDDGGHDGLPDMLRSTNGPF